LSEEPILQVKNLSFSYPEKKGVLKNINLEVERGERIAVIGPNGSGKTTLFLLICGVLKPHSGKITAMGEKVEHNRFNPRTCYLFQSPDDQLFSSTIFDDVAFGPLNMGLSRREVERRVQDALEKTGCKALAERIPHHLSGGEKRMAAIASILSMNPEIILFDEPTSNLDSRNRRKVINTLNSLSQTILASSHDLEFLLETCEKVILLDEGEIVKTGSIRAIMGEENLMQSHHLEKPHSLIHSLHIPHSHG